MKWLATTAYYVFLALYYLLFAGALLAIASILILDLTSSGGIRGVMLRTPSGWALLALLAGAFALSAAVRRRLSRRGEARSWLLYGRYCVLSWAFVLIYWSGRYVARSGAFRRGLESDDFWGLIALPVILSFPWILRAGAGRRQALLLAVLLQGASCAGERAVELGEEFTLRVGESAAVRGSEIRIRVDGVGHGWLAEGGAHFLFAELSLTSEGGSRSVTTTRRDEIAVGDYTVQVLDILERGSTARPGGDEGCTLRVAEGLPAKSGR